MPSSNIVICNDKIITVCPVILNKVFLPHSPRWGKKSFCGIVESCQRQEERLAEVSGGVCCPRAVAGWALFLPLLYVYSLVNPSVISFIHPFTHLSVESILGASHVFFFFLTEDAKRYDIIPVFERLDSAGICTDV